jgi:hypothetical protein
MVETARWIIGGSLAVAALVIIVANWGYPITYALTGKRGSVIPIVGGFCGALACITLPIAGTPGFWWLPLVIDAGCLGGLITAVPVAIAKRFRR